MGIISKRASILSPCPPSSLSELVRYRLGQRFQSLRVYDSLFANDYEFVIWSSRKVFQWSPQLDFFTEKFTTHESSIVMINLGVWGSFPYGTYVGPLTRVAWLHRRVGSGAATRNGAEVIVTSCGHGPLFCGNCTNKTAEGGSPPAEQVLNHQDTEPSFTQGSAFACWLVKVTVWFLNI